MNSENSETFYPHRLLLKLLDKIDLKRSDKHKIYQILHILAYTIHGKI